MLKVQPRIKSTGKKEVKICIVIQGRRQCTQPVKIDQEWVRAQKEMLCKAYSNGGEKISLARGDICINTGVVFQVILRRGFGLDYTEIYFKGLKVIRIYYFIS